MRAPVVIGGASAMWGDSAIATPQLLTVPRLDYLVYDFLAETTMAILARARARSPEAGFATDFVSEIIEPHLETIADRGIKIITNAGGLNPLACRAAIERHVARRGLNVTVAAVTGDDVTSLLPELCRGGATTETGSPLPADVISANAYLGARPIVEALTRGADVVVTGRSVDSALVVAPLVHEFGWAWDEYDLLAQATLAGHVIECGAQATGGLFTDWEDVDDWADIGYPIIECDSNGGVTLSKPPGTGGLITPGAVAEQVLYEIGDPSAYLMPDVICDLREVRLARIDEQSLRLEGARGRPPTASSKVSATYAAGYQVETLLAIRGRQAPEKARRTADALLARTRRQMQDAGLGDYRNVVVELLGCESHYGPHTRVLDTREVVLRIAARHDERTALEFLRREAPSAGTSMAPGTRGHFGGRAEIKPAVGVVSLLIDRSRIHPEVHVGTDTVPVEWPATPDNTRDAPGTEAAPANRGAVADRQPPAESRRVPLAALAWARSGDKGDTCNIGVIARRRELFDALRASLTAEHVADYFAHLLDGGHVDRYELPGLHALNFVLHRALGGGGMASLRSDPLGKSFAQMLLDLDVVVPASAIAAAMPDAMIQPI